MASVELDRVSVDLDGARVLHDVSLAADDGQLVAVVGPSGSGKTTVLRAVAGLCRVAAGTVRIGGVDVTAADPAARDVGMVFQQPALFPNRTVRRNVSFPLEVRRTEVAEIRRRVDAEARAMHLEQLLLRKPTHLSRGEAQLVQIARTMVRVPTVLLLDEPFAALDHALHARMRAEIGVLQRGYGVTTLMSTNDPADTASLPDRLVVLEHGRVAQIGAWADIHRSPATLDTALTTGSLSAIPVTVETDREGFWLLATDPAGGVRLRAWMPSLADRVGQQVTLGIRPEDLAIGAGGELRGRVDRVVPGSPLIIGCRVAGQTVWAQVPKAAVSIGDAIELRVARSTLFDPSSGHVIV